MNGIPVLNDPNESFWDAPHVQVPTLEFRKITQRMLQETGDYTSTIDGKFGSGSRKAFSAFRGRAGIEVPDFRVHRVDPPTWEALCAATSPHARRLFL